MAKQELRLRIDVSVLIDGEDAFSFAGRIAAIKARTEAFLNGVEFDGAEKAVTSRLVRPRAPSEVAQTETLPLPPPTNALTGADQDQADTEPERLKTTEDDDPLDIPGFLRREPDAAPEAQPS